MTAFRLRSLTFRAILSTFFRFRARKSSLHSRSALPHLDSSKTSRRSRPPSRKSPARPTQVSLTSSQASWSSQPTRSDLCRFMLASLILQAPCSMQVSCCSIVSSSRFEQLRFAPHFILNSLSAIPRIALILTIRCVLRAQRWNSSTGNFLRGGWSAAHFRRCPCGSAITRGGTRRCDSIERHISSAFSISRRSPSLSLTVLLTLTTSRLSFHSHPLLVLTLILCFSSSLCSLFPSQSRPTILNKKNHWTCRPSFVAVSL